jgi:hypothetical protein
MPCTLGVRVAWLVVTARIAMFGDENDALPSHRELNAVRRMLGPDPGASDLSGFDGVWLVPGVPDATHAESDGVDDNNVIAALACSLMARSGSCDRSPARGS